MVIPPAAGRKGSFSSSDFLSSPSRSATGSLRVDFLDQWRGVAVLSVFLYHSFGTAFARFHPEWQGWLPDFAHVPKSFIALFAFSWGWVGVPIFFVISGFCIHLSFQRRPNLQSFYEARFFRIYPPYAIAMLFFGIIFPFTRLHLHSLSDAEQLGGHLLLVHNFNAAWIYTISPSFWTIAVEAQLYLLYPILLLLLRRMGWRNALILLAFIEISLRLTASSIYAGKNTWPPEWLASAPFTFWFSWAIGAAVAESYINGEKPSFGRFSPWGLALLGGACILFKPLFFMSFLIVALATAAGISRALETNGHELAEDQGFFKEHLERAGVLSYSIYLLHQPFLVFVSWLIFELRIVGSAHPLKIFGLCLAAWIPTVAISSFYFRYCERPSIELGKLARRMRAQEFKPAATAV